MLASGDADDVRAAARGSRDLTGADEPRGLGPLLRRIVFDRIVGLTVGPTIRLMAALMLAGAGVFLTVAWQSGPQRLLDAATYRHFTSSAEGEIVESWLAVDWNPEDMKTSLHWRAFAKASPCAVVVYRGDWDAPARRAFCGNRLGFNEDYTVHDLREMAPGVPFDWSRDPSGFVVPEIRIDARARQWLADHPPVAPFPSDPPPATALDALRLQLDRPIDDAIAGWSTRRATFPLALDPKDPAGALPAGFVDARRALSPSWLAVLVLGPLGLWVWVRAMQLVLGDIAWLAGWIITLIPLVFLPWWGEQLPRALRALDSDIAGVAADMLGDVDPTGRLVASEPADAVLAGGERLIWRAGQAPYDATFGRFRFTAPTAPPASADAALATLVASITTQMRSLPEGERVAVFERLTRDKTIGLTRAGLGFVPAAKEALLARGDATAVARAASGFLSAWVTQPVEEPDPRDLGYRERVTLFRALGDLEVPEIAIMARSIAERHALDPAP